ncbi:MAG: IS21 family transposase [Acidobacteria bacterium]|nr:IS21 family transposase [Acidobacteriota bacterium]
MLGMEEWMEVKDLKRQGHSIKQICRMTGYSRNTVRKVLREGSPKRAAETKRGSKLDAYKDYLKKRYEKTGLSAVRLTGEIRGMGFAGSWDIVRRYLRELDVGAKVSAKATVRFETPPGKQAQADWAEIGSYIDEKGRRRKIYAFVMVLGYSRAMYVEYTRRMRMPELIGCLERAFAYFGGWPETILFDNMAQVRLPCGKLNPQMADFLNHYGIAPRTHRPYRPRTKGKVERAVGYLKDNFIKGREFADLADLQAQGAAWLEEANGRKHATTGKRPFDLLPEEGLTPYGAPPRYRPSVWKTRKVGVDGYVSIGGVKYSVPPEAVGRKVVVEQGERRVTVRTGETVIAEHRRSLKSGESVADPAHVAAMWKLTVETQEAPPKRSGRVLFETVAVAPLVAYEEVIG